MSESDVEICRFAQKFIADHEGEVTALQQGEIESFIEGRVGMSPMSADGNSAAAPKRTSCKRIDLPDIDGFMAESFFGADCGPARTLLQRAAGGTERFWDIIWANKLRRTLTKRCFF